MKKKAVFLIFVFTSVAASSFSQTVKEKIDKQIRDPKTTENSGKADVYIQKKTIYDSVAIQTKDQPLVSKRVKRKGHCKKDSHKL